MDAIVEFVHGITALIVALTSLLGAIAVFIKTIRDNKKDLEEGSMSSETQSKGIESKGLITRYKKRIIFCIFLIIIGTGILAVKAGTKALPPNARLTVAAWEAYNKKDYDLAIEKADECINKFKATAKGKQNSLEENKTKMPPVGEVKDEAKKNEILERGVLNDVATCWFIKGQALEDSGKIKAAIEAYREATKFTYARTYDESWNGFWSPAQAASDKIMDLEEK